MLKSGKKNIGKNITELKKDNLKQGKEKGSGGVARPQKQILAIALSKAIPMKAMPMKISTKAMDKKMEGKKEDTKKHENMETPKFKKVEKKEEKVKPKK